MLDITWSTIAKDLANVFLFLLSRMRQLFLDLSLVRCGFICCFWLGSGEDFDAGHAGGLDSLIFWLSSVLGVGKGSLSVVAFLGSVAWVVDSVSWDQDLESLAVSGFVKVTLWRSLVRDFDFFVCALKLSGKGEPNLPW